MTNPTETSVAEIEIYVMIDENGDYVVASDESDIADRYDSDIGGDAGLARRTFRLNLKAPLPRTATVAGTLPDTDGPVNLTIS